MTIAMRELDDRWILPLRGSTLTAVEWDDSVTFRLEPAGEITVGRGALLTQGSVSAPHTNIQTLREVGVDGVQQCVGRRILSSVGFKDGALRVVLDNGWHLTVREEGPFVAAKVILGGALIWSRPDIQQPM